MLYVDYVHRPPTFVSGLFMLYLPAVNSQAQGTIPSANDDPFFFLGVYALIGLATLLVTVFTSAMTYLGAFIASRRLFKELLDSVTQATMHWYDVTPVGRIMNRFSKDIEKLDAPLPDSVRQVTASFAGFVVAVLVVVSVFPIFLIPAICIGFFYAKIGIAYLETGRDLRRMESTTRSPVFAFFGELLDGVVTVRAFSAENWFLETLCSKVDLTLKMNYMYWVTNRWLLIRFDCLGTLAILLTSVLSISSKSGHLAGWAALCITSAMSLTNNCYWMCRL